MSHIRGTCCYFFYVYDIFNYFRSTFGRPGRIQLAELFAFPISAGPATTQGGFSMKYVEDLWTTGLTNMDTDLELLEMLQSDLETEFDEDVHTAV